MITHQGNVVDNQVTGTSSKCLLTMWHHLTLLSLVAVMASHHVVTVDTGIIPVASVGLKYVCNFVGM